MKLQFTDASPFRIAAFGKHYSDELSEGRICETLDDARKAARKGDWICSVSLLGRVLFFTTYRPDRYPPLEAGNVIGRWNELTLIERATATRRKAVSP